MTNLECAVAVLVRHREARQWSDEAVAVDLVAALGLDAAGDVGAAAAAMALVATAKTKAPVEPKVAPVVATPEPKALTSDREAGEKE